MKFAIFSHIAQKESASIQQRLDEFAREVRLADELGYDFFFTTEHHFSGRFSLAPSQPISLTVIAQNSSRLRFGPMVVQLPISQPLRVVEEMLILDHMSGGRLEIGLGRGITPHEHTSYGIPTKTDHARFNEGMEFVLKALLAEGPFSWVGEYYHYVDVDLPWRPLQVPHPPIWVPTNTASSAYEYGKRGFGIGGFAIVGVDHYRSVFDEYRRGCDEVGIPSSEQRVSYLADTIVAETDEEAERLMHDHFVRQLALFEDERIRSRAVVDSEMRRATEASLARMAGIRGDLDAAGKGLRFVHGSPATVTEKIQRLRDELGVNVYIGEFSFGELTYEQVERSHRLFATEVMPALAASHQLATTG
jgi:alkanesulfonate monooxygenase SsuD/methylene tetrahydromethanopterin reductase-like flavin-dependent oxidoreductase (luciferase family)